jgi:hypothetical protein
MSRPLTSLSIALGLLAFGAGAAAAAGPSEVRGEYIEARTAEIFAGGCVMNSQAETMGKQAVLAWRVTDGAVNGVDVSGLSVVAAIAGDHNLGIREMGGAAPSDVRALIYVDERATAAQRRALVSLTRVAIDDLPVRVLDVRAVPITFERTAHAAAVSAGDATLRIDPHVHHDPSCGAMKWFHPLSKGAQAEVGLTRTQVFSGDALGTRWRQADRKSAFVGTFAFGVPGDS